MSKAKTNLKTRQYELNKEHMEKSMIEKNRNCCGTGCCQFWFFNTHTLFIYIYIYNLMEIQLLKRLKSDIQLQLKWLT